MLPGSLWTTEAVHVLNVKRTQDNLSPIGLLTEYLCSFYNKRTVYSQ